MVDVRGDVLRPPHGTTPAAVKSNIKLEMYMMYLRNKGKRCSNFDVKAGSQNVDYASVYRYLWVHLNEHVAITAETLSKAGGGALSAVILKIQKCNDVVFKIYSKLSYVYSCVVPILDYCSREWGFRYFDKVDRIQNWAGTGGHGIDPGPRHTKVVKNGTSCSSLGTQTYEVELGLVDPVSG